MNVYIKALLLSLTVLTVFIGCSGEPAFTDLENNNLVINLKGTYASNSPQDWNIPGGVGALETNSIDDYSGAPYENPTYFAMDIAEIRLVDTEGKQHKFSNYRQGVVATIDNTTEPFFNGAGVILQGDDVPEGNYLYVLLYVRKMIFDKSITYHRIESGWQSLGSATTTFFEKNVFGYNVNDRLTQAYADAIKYETSVNNRVFPIVISIKGGLNIQNSYPSVLEIRIVLKNFIKRYESDYYTGSGFCVTHYYGPSDWVRKVEAGENDIGGNLHTVARTYIQGYTGVITGVAAASDNYYIAVPAGETIEDYTYDGLINRGNQSADCDLPRYPSVPVTIDIMQYLDYFLKVEDYNEEWNALVPGTCDSFTTYQNNWNAYISEVENFSVAPLATFSSGVTYTITNVPPGTYEVYRFAAPTYGEFFAGSGTQLGSPVTVTAGGSVSP